MFNSGFTACKISCRDPYGSRGSKLPLQHDKFFHFRRDPYGSRGSKSFLIGYNFHMLSSRDPYGSRGSKFVAGATRSGKSLSRSLWISWI